MDLDEIPVAHTPPGGWQEMPPPVLDRCTTPLADNAIDMRGMWRIVELDWKLGEPPDPNPFDGHVQRIEQCGDRVCITASGIVHDMRADGTEANAVHDVAAANGQPITVVASFEGGDHVLRPVGVDGVEVRRRLDGDHLIWEYGPLFTARLERVS